MSFAFGFSICEQKENRMSDHGTLYFGTCIFFSVTIYPQLDTVPWRYVCAFFFFLYRRGL